MDETDVEADADRVAGQRAALWATVTNPDAKVEVVGQARQGIDETGPCEAGFASSAREEGHDLAAQKGSAAGIACVVGSAFQPNDCCPSCCRAQAVAVLGRGVGFDCARPMALLAHPALRVADMLADERLVEEERQLGWEDHSWVDP